MSGDGTYAPKSPDLSSFYSPGPTPAEPETQQVLEAPSQSDFSRLQPPSGTYFSTSQRQQQHQHGGQLAHEPLTGNPARSVSYPTGSKHPSFGGLGVGYSPPAGSAQNEYFPPVVPPAQPAPGYTTHGPQQRHFQYQYQPPQHYPITAQAAQLHHPQQGPYSYPAATTNTSMPPRRAAAAAAAAALQQQRQEDQLQGQLQLQQQQQQQQQQHYQQPPQLPSSSSAAAGPSTASGSASASAVIQPSPVKTKFPTARIKRIMQADEEVGKVAQQTPIAVGKALEQFMVALVTRSAEVARQKNSKRVSAQMLKQVVESDDQWDFLRDIVGKVEAGEEKEKGKGAAAEKGGKVKAESEGSEEEGGAGGAVKKKRGGGRKKKGKAE